MDEAITAINGLLPPNLQLTGDSAPSDLWAALYRLHGDYIQGPKGSATWKDKALDMLISSTKAPAVPSDTELLDFLDKMNARKNEQNGTRYGWKLSENCNRIALEDHNYPALTARDAIRAAIRQSPATKDEQTGGAK